MDTSSALSLVNTGTLRQLTEVSKEAVHWIFRVIESKRTCLSLQVST